LTGWGVFALGRNNPKVRAILTQVAGYHTEVIKFLPPLTITREDIDYFLLAMESVLDDLRDVPGHAWNTVLGLVKGAMRA
jgi:4-aminobutyrate aminotransferase-like enzyme